MAASAQPVISPYNKETWQTYIETILYEAKTETNQTDPTDPSLPERINRNLRPFLLLSITAAVASSPLTTSIQTDHKKEEKTEESKEKKKSSFVLLASSALTYLLNNQLKAANASLTKTNEFMNHAFNLKNDYHSNLLKIDHRVTHVSEKIFEIVEQVKAIDQIRANQANNSFRSGFFTFVGSVVWILGAYTSTRWIATAGKVALFVSLLLYGFNWMYHHGDLATIRQKYQDIIDKIEDKIDKATGNRIEGIRASLNYYEHDMKLQQMPHGIEINLESLTYGRPTGD